MCLACHISSDLWIYSSTLTHRHICSTKKESSLKPKYISYLSISYVRDQHIVGIRDCKPDAAGSDKSPRLTVNLAEARRSPLLHIRQFLMIRVRRLADVQDEPLPAGSHVGGRRRTVGGPSAFMSALQQRLEPSRPTVTLASPTQTRGTCRQMMNYVG